MSIQQELIEIKGNRDILTAEDVVEWARSHPDSELHNAPEFCGWNLKKSAYEHWLWAARRLIALNITYEDGTRKFVSLSIDRTRDGGGYRDVDDVLREKGLHEIMMADALRELERVQAKYDRLTKLQPVWAEVEKIRKSQPKRKERNLLAAG